MIKSLLDIAISVISFSKHFSKKEHVTAIADWTLSVGKLIDDLATSLTNHEFPSGSCAKIEVYIDSFSAIAGSTLNAVEIDNIQSLLNEVRNIERVFGDFVKLSVTDKANNIAMLRAASGRLIAHGEMLRLKK